MHWGACADNAGAPVQRGAPAAGADVLLQQPPGRGRAAAPAPLQRLPAPAAQSLAAFPEESIFHGREIPDRMQVRGPMHIALCRVPYFFGQVYFESPWADPLPLADFTTSIFAA